jgi:hypothetical protein
MAILRFFVFVRGADCVGLTVTFDEVLSALEGLPRMFVEPDGSFVWTGEAQHGPWQVDGNLIDRGDVLAYAELKGRCPPGRLDELLRALGWPQTPLAFELPQRGVVLDEIEFRRQAAGEAGAV